jgi:peptide/nickel transport system ATP-binding protein
VTDPVVCVQDLRLELVSGEPVVEDVTFRIERGQILGLVGESGSGKTTTALALLGYHRRGIRRTRGTITIAGESLTEHSERGLRRLRGRLISYVPQEPAMALNPSIRIGDQIGAMLRAHAPERADDSAVERALRQVELPHDQAFMRRFPHQLSGGQQQRVAISVALVCRPAVVVLDEPTTGLDVVVQQGLLTEIRRLADENGLAILYVSHDLAVVGSIADRIAVMYAGRVVEEGPAAGLTRAPRHPYTSGLVSAVPDPLVPRRLHGIPGVAVGVGERGTGCAFAPRCQLRIPRCEEAMPDLEAVAEAHRARCFEWAKTPQPRIDLPQLQATAATTTALLEVASLSATHRARRQTVVAAQDISFSIAAGECVALVGESGSGKTTIARCIVGLHQPESGTISMSGSTLAATAGRRSIEARRKVQIVFQNPYDSLNPRHKVVEIVARPARQFRHLSRHDAQAETRALLELVRLPTSTGHRYPSELSGGERQRVANARALAARPDLLVCDEVTSALDVSVQGAVLELLGELRKSLALSMLFISHDLGVVASVSDRVLVLSHGHVCEEGPVRTVLEHPRHEYTQRLIAAAPRMFAGNGDFGAADSRETQPA